MNPPPPVEPNLPDLTDAILTQIRQGRPSHTIDGKAAQYFAAAVVVIAMGLMATAWSISDGSENPLVEMGALAQIVEMN